MPDDARANGAQPQGDTSKVTEFLRQAAAACDAGNPVLGMHLYLAAFGFANSNEDLIACEDAIRGLKRAWSVACGLKERSIAEYIFEKMEPYLTADEMNHCANQLQELALDKLEEFGLSRDALQDMSNMFAGNMMGMDGFSGARIMHVEKIPGGIPGAAFQVEMPYVDGGLDVLGLNGPEDVQEAPEIAVQPLEEVAVNATEPPESALADADEASMAVPAEIVEQTLASPDVEVALAQAAETAAEMASAQQGTQLEYSEETPFFNGLAEGDALPAKKPQGPTAEEQLRKAFEQTKARMVPQAAPTAVAKVAEALDYTRINGYATAIADMASLGVGVADDPDFQALVAVLNESHGLDRMPAADTLLFRAPAREDAARFLQATLGEIGLSSLRMSMEENMQGLPVLCVMANNNSRPKMNAAHNAFEAPAVLIIDDLDLWSVPQVDQGEGLEGFVMSQMSRGAREAINLIHNAVENPDVYVLASLSSYGEVDPFFCDLLAPFTVVEIENPNEDERYDIWAALTQEHPSLAYIDTDDLVRFSSNMSRADIYLATREAIEEAYKRSLASREYAPVKPENLFEKLSAYQPLESDEYKRLEDSVAGMLRDQLEGSVDDFLGLSE